ncbi:hypothetical protein BC833DRAFT_287367 [Globomyces pollinis-pini]|nr:hypothetical protein BC833DRAFT_287367 [Globomyces pollinis-pini]
MDLEHFTGLLEYMEELFNLDIEELNSYLANAIVDSILVQVIYPAFYKGLQAQCAALFFCTRFIKTISHVYLIDYVLDMVLGDFTGTVTLNTPKPSIGDQEDNISDTKSTIKPQEDGRRICMTLSLLYTIITTFESNPSRNRKN